MQPSSELPWEICTSFVDREGNPVFIIGSVERPISGPVVAHVAREDDAKRIVRAVNNIDRVERENAAHIMAIAALREERKELVAALQTFIAGVEMVEKYTGGSERLRANIASRLFSLPYQGTAQQKMTKNDNAILIEAADKARAILTKVRP